MYRRKNGLYEKQITINGRRVAFYGSTEREVLKKIAEYKGEVKKGRTFSTVAEEWEREHEPEIAYNTWSGYLRPIKDVRAEFDGFRINEITPAMIQRFINTYARQGRAKQTIKLRRTVLHQIFDHAILHGDVLFNPVSAVTVPKNAPKEIRALPQDDQIELVKKSLSFDFGLFAFLLLYTGCRRGEALALRFEDIDRAAGIIHISRSLYWIGNRPEIKLPKTESGQREIVLLDVLAAAIPSKKTGYLFPSPSNSESPLLANEYRTLWERYCKSAGLIKTKQRVCHNRIINETVPGITPHQLRHAYATMLFDAGIDEKDAQELLGHSKISMTKDVYTHIKRSRKAQTAKKLNDFTVGQTESNGSKDI
ncbi:site-specific integrase [Anaerotruncus massiliensis (ex Togo et al. 2019)]|jgi:integrase family protein|uniref:tyrosine-type recombinase/integrase n=1 Tax=Anaerotruncus massiliensis (ex Togo et al. 2019) TaxID=1673720 RepID=UPI00207E346B|nr:site-specific integrase [Anaerotruncus massiliensis (ex Togo et al. 2019)]GKH47110.1 site-specific integrase [Oscillospiraceae bacterium]